MQLRRSLGAVAILLSLARVAGAQAGAPIQLSERDCAEAPCRHEHGTWPQGSLPRAIAVATVWSIFSMLERIASS